MEDIKVEYLSIEQLKKYENNAKIHTPEQIEQIKNSIQEFGMNDPIAVWKNNEIIEGHGRLIACQQLGIKKVPVIRLDKLTDEQRKAYGLVHNKLTMNTDFDFSKLDEELEALKNIDMSQFGFEENIDIEEPHEIIEDNPPEEVEPRVKLGDLWQMGGHRLICGDSTDIAVIDRLMDGVKADMVFTDPPYGMKKESEGVLNDNLNFDDLLDFNRQWIPLTFGALKDNASWYCWGIDEPLMDIYSNILKPMAKQRQISKTSSIQRKKDLSKHLKKLWKEYSIAKSNMKIAEGKHEEQRRSSVTICGLAHGGSSESHPNVEKRRSDRQGNLKKDRCQNTDHLRMEEKVSAICGSL